MRIGRRLGIDWGEARIGVAACDPAGTMSFPVQTVPAGDRALAQLLDIVAEYEPIEIVVGLPRSLSGGEGPAAARIRDHAAALAVAVANSGVGSDVRVRLVDERLTTVSASRMLSGQGRSAKRQRSVIDQAAAVAILDNALDAERGTGTPPGEELRVRQPPSGEAGA
ncbi:Holliday junction resolvase RuvX [Naumannella halotolerans]|uniref:Putative pre-16S rRNA nuclease n=1 Tax=Naumannella halotolerans TaxID=993414 RepID=A0A4V3ENM2_9ACTN|nr:Holliday junction resolvase RuvX [Naumannella halotolerans]TDT33488.1 putative Holliday junction resolvase [Naumannella halotolerans]